jgi:hypothetical protein
MGNLYETAEVPVGKAYENTSLDEHMLLKFLGIKRVLAKTELKFKLCKDCHFKNINTFIDIFW